MTRTESITLAFVEAAKLAPILAGLVERDQWAVLAADSLPGAVISEVSEDEPTLSNTRAQNTLTIAVKILGKGQDRRSDIDTARAQIHRAVWTDAALRALVLTLERGSAEWADEPAEEPICSVTQHYRATYRTMAADLELAG